MMNNLKKVQFFCLVIVICGFSFCPLYAQNLTSSPYSMFGIGEIESEDMGWNSGMGSTGIGIRSSNFLNRVNPASYNAIDTLSFMYEFALNARFSKFESASSDQHINSINFKKLDLGFKLKPYWSMALGIVPFSSVGYKVNRQKGIEGSYENFTDNIEGSGGITRVYWGNSLNVTKHLSIGINSSFLFGSISQTETLQSSEFSNAVYSTNNTTLKNLYFEYGMQYSNRLNSHLDFTLGVVGASRTKLNKYSTINVITADNITTLLDETTYKGSFTLPEYYGGGFSVTANNKLTVAADYRLQKWSKVKSENGLSSYVDSRKLSVGLQYIPANRLPKNYFERIYYQAGASVERSYLRLNGTLQNNYSVSAGLCLPLHFQKSYIHIGVQEGQKGSVSNILFRETYTLVTFGIVMHDFWFIKSKFD